MGGRVQAGSGSSWRAPNDVVAPEYLEELKFTDSWTYGLKLVDWLKLRRNAHRMGREPRMVIDFPHKRVRLVIHEEPYDG